VQIGAATPSLYEPDKHSVQLAGPNSSLYLPGRQAVHWSFSNPFVHTQSFMLVLPGFDVPRLTGAYRQLVQVVVQRSDEYLPASDKEQLSGLGLPQDVPYLPAPHGKHVDLEVLLVTVEYLPR
jgi:hypothetical protein